MSCPKTQYDWDVNSVKSYALFLVIAALANKPWTS